MAFFVYPAVTIDTTGLATEAKQDAIITELQQIEADVEAGNALLTTIDADTSSIAADSATTATNTGTTATNTGTIATNTGTTATNTGNTASSVASIDGKVSTEAKQDTVITQLTNLNSKMDGDAFNIDHDHRTWSYVAAGTGIGQPSTAVLRTGGAGGSIVRTVTYTYTTNALGDDVLLTQSW